VRVGDAIDVFERRATTRVGGGVSWAKGMRLNQVVGAVIAIIIGMCVALFVRHSGDVSQLL